MKIKFIVFLTQSFYAAQFTYSLEQILVFKV